EGLGAGEALLEVAGDLGDGRLGEAAGDRVDRHRLARGGPREAGLLGADVGAREAGGGLDGGREAVGRGRLADAFDELAELELALVEAGHADVLELPGLGAATPGGGAHLAERVGPGVRAAVE